MSPSSRTITPLLTHITTAFSGGQRCRVTTNTQVHASKVEVPYKTSTEIPKHKAANEDTIRPLHPTKSGCGRATDPPTAPLAQTGAPAAKETSMPTTPIPISRETQ